MLVKELKAKIEARYHHGYTRSVIEQARTTYALELIEYAELQDDDEVPTLENLRDVLLNGAQNWHEYSWGGCSLIYDEDIAERICTPSMLVKKDYGRLQYAPRKGLDWLDAQANILKQAYGVIHRIIVTNH